MRTHDIRDLGIEEETELSLLGIPLIAHGVESISDDVTGKGQDARPRGSQCGAAARTAYEGHRGRTIAEQAVDYRRAHRRVKYACLRAKSDSHLPGMSRRPSGRDAERVQARIAAHTYDVHPVAVRRDTRFADEQGTQPGREESRRCHAAEEGYIGQLYASIPQACLERPRAHADCQSLVFVEQLPLSLLDARSIAAYRGQDRKS